MPNVVGLQFSALLLLLVAAPLGSVTPNNLPTSYVVQPTTQHYHHPRVHHSYHTTHPQTVPQTAHAQQYFSPYFGPYADAHQPYGPVVNFRRSSFSSPTWPYQRLPVVGSSHPYSQSYSGQLLPSVVSSHSSTALGPYLGDGDVRYATEIRRASSSTPWGSRIRSLPLSQRRQMTVNSFDPTLWYQRYRSALSQSQPSSSPIIYQKSVPKIREISTSNDSSSKSRSRKTQPTPTSQNELKIQSSAYSNYTSLSPYSNENLKRTAPDTSAGFFSKAIENVMRYIPPMKIGSRHNPGCVGGTKCQFFAFCWMQGGSLGASCGPLHTCCVTPSSQDIQPQYWGPVINDPQCGKSATRISRIVGGSDASFGQFPWQAFVQVGGSRCGGALVGPAHVVTAGHCVARSQHNPSSIRVTLGDYILHSEIESLPHEVFTVSEVKLHPNFRFTPQADRYDVAVLVLDRSVQYRENIMPICLPPKGTIYLGRSAFVAGWGALQAGSKLRPKVLQHVPVPVIENPVCEGWHKQRGINIKIYDEMMCAGYETGGKDACQGDSGGPLMLNEYGVWYLIGIVSAGYSCAKQYQPGIYHRVSSSSDWVSANVFPNAHYRSPSAAATVKPPPQSSSSR